MVGITRSTMKFLKQNLLKNDEVNYVAATNKTDSIGRWDIITMENCQETLQGWIEETLNKLLEECPEESFHDRPEEFPEPGMQSRNARMTEEDSSQAESHIDPAALEAMIQWFRISITRIIERSQATV